MPRAKPNGKGQKVNKMPTSISVAPTEEFVFNELLIITASIEEHLMNVRDMIITIESRVFGDSLAAAESSPTQATGGATSDMLRGKLSDLHTLALYIRDGVVNLGRL